MSETVDGTRRSGEQRQPADRPATAPLWAWPPRPIDVLKFFFGFPGYLWPWNAIFIGIAIATWAFTQPDLSRMAEFRIDWIAQIYVRNLGLLLLFTGGLHLWLYTMKGQGTKYKFHPKWLGEKNPRFLFGSQVPDNIFWSIVSGCTVWTAYESLMMWSYANDLVPRIEWKTEPIYFVVLLALLVFWQTIHFYFVHRLLHWKPLYRGAHYLHHKNTNVGPWTGLAMHPAEHLIYFTTILLFWIVPSHPVHTMLALQIAALMSTVGHIGFDKLVVTKKVSFPSDFFHYLHHRHFECNFGNTIVPFDLWFGTFHDGTPEAHARMTKMWRKKRFAHRGH